MRDFCLHGGLHQHTRPWIFAVLIQAWHRPAMFDLCTTTSFVNPEIRAPALSTSAHLFSCTHPRSRGCRSSCSKPRRSATLQSLKQQQLSQMQRPSSSSCRKQLSSWQMHGSSWQMLQRAAMPCTVSCTPCKPPCRKWQTKRMLPSLA